MIKNIFRFGVIVFTLAVFAYGYLRPEPKDELSTVNDVFPPIENADGTVDYTLAQRTRLEFKGYYWIVRLPKDQYVQESKPGSDRIGIVNGAEVGLNTYSNQYLSLFFKWPSKQPFPANATIEQIYSEPHLNLFLRSNHHKRDFRSNYYLTDTVKGCTLKGEVSKNVFEYLPSKSNSTECNYFELSGQKNRFFSVRDDAGNHIAEIKCNSDPAEDCHLTMSTINDRSLSASFQYREVPVSEFVNLVRGIEEYLKTVTVRVVTVEKNVPYKPSPRVN
jgi:hypothetical protein